jgi:hypothetical protein
MTHKEFYIWLEGYLYGKLENKHIDIAPIVEKMGQVNDKPKISIAEPYRSIPMPINPFPQTNDPLTPPWTITCETKQQLND